MRRTAYIGLGANLGEAAATLDAAIEALKGLEQSSFVAASPLYASEPVDATGPDYLNAVVQLDTALEPYGLLLHLLEMEMMLGRKRRGGEARRNAPRNVDLDLLMLGGLIMRSTPLTLPHPRMHERAFVLRPLLDLAPGIAIPGRGEARRLLEAVAYQRCTRFDGSAPAAPAAPGAAAGEVPGPVPAALGTAPATGTAPAVAAEAPAPDAAPPAAQGGGTGSTTAAVPPLAAGPGGPGVAPVPLGAAAPAAPSGGKDA